MVVKACIISVSFLQDVKKLNLRLFQIANHGLNMLLDILFTVFVQTKRESLEVSMDVKHISATSRASKLQSELKAKVEEPFC
jgi:hypothetical protein